MHIDDINKEYDKVSKNSIQVNDTYKQSISFSTREIRYIEKFKKLLIPKFLAHFKNSFIEFQKNNINNSNSFYVKNIFQIGLFPHKGHQLPTCFTKKFKTIWNVLGDVFIDEINKYMLKNYGYAFLFSDPKDGLLYVSCFRFGMNTNINWFNILRFNKIRVEDALPYDVCAEKYILKENFVTCIKDNKNIMLFPKNKTEILTYDDAFIIEDIYNKKDEEPSIELNTDEYICLYKDFGDSSPGKYMSIERIEKYLQFTINKNECIYIVFKGVKRKELQDKHRSQLKDYIKELIEQKIEGLDGWLPPLY